MNSSANIFFKGAEYDVSQWLYKHPGGSKIILDYLSLDKNITQVFKSMHSKEAEKKLLQLPKIGKVERTKNEKLYLKIQQRVNRLYSPSYHYQIILVMILIPVFVVSLWVSHPLLSIISFSICQIFAAWISHSSSHSHHKWSQLVGQIIGGLILGLSWRWWKQKHTSHHIFTNNQALDVDIQHNYPTFLFPFLLIKWRLQSILFALMNLRMKEISMLFIHYFLLSKQKFFFLILGLLIAGFYIAVVVFGNHQRQKRFKRGFIDNFMQHQIGTTTDYNYDHEVMDILLGGFQNHTEHHLFPQVPFYNLKEVKKIVNQELYQSKQQINISSIF